MKINVSTPSTQTAVQTGDLQDWLRYNSTDEADLLAAILRAENDYAEKATNRALLTQTIDLYLDDWAQIFHLPRPPLQSVSSVGYRVKGSTSYTVASSSRYLVNTHGMSPYIELRADKCWPTDELEAVNPIRIRYVAGATSVAQVPEAIKTAIKLNAASRFQHREEDSEADIKRTGASGRLLNLYRVRSF